MNVCFCNLVWIKDVLLRATVPLDTCALHSATVLADLRWEEGALGWCLGSNNVRLIKHEWCSEPQTDGKLTPAKTADETPGLRIAAVVSVGREEGARHGTAAHAGLPRCRMKWLICGSRDGVSGARGLCDRQLYDNERSRQIHTARAVGRWPGVRERRERPAVGCLSLICTRVGCARVSPGLSAASIY